MFYKSLYNNIFQQVIIDIANGNDENLFQLTQINEWSADIRTVSSLRSKHGNYTLIIRAQDMGIPSLQTEESLKICVTDYNDHAPEFISPPFNSTLKVPEVNKRKRSENF